MKLKLASALALVLLTAVTSEPAHARGVAAAEMTACTTSAAQAERRLVGKGTMRRLSGASRMQIRFELQGRSPDRPAWHALPAPGFGVWNTADPAIRRYVYEKRVEGLASPADYRLSVQFRWLDGSRQIAQQRRITRICRQNDLRPDLVPLKVVFKGAARKATGRYVVRIANLGSTASGPFSTVLSVNGVSLPPASVPGLAPRARLKLEMPGPGCAAGTSLLVHVDAAGQVDERDEARNQLVVPCVG